MLDPPPVDANGDVVPHDHEGIRGEDGVIRCISEQHIVTDEKINGRRLSSILFKESSGPNGGMSIDLQREIEEAGRDARRYVTESGWVGALRFLAGQLREEGFLVGYHPIPGNPYHGEVWGTFSRGKQKRLRAMCEWFVQIDGVSI